MNNMNKPLDIDSAVESVRDHLFQDKKNNEETNYSIILRTFGLSLLTFSGWLNAGGVGIVVGILCVIAATRGRSVIFIAAIAHACGVILFPELFSVQSLTELGLFELGVVTVIASRRPVAPSHIGLIISVPLGVAGCLLAVIYSIGIFEAAIGLLVVGGLLSYAIHRYERVSLNLVSDDSKHRQFRNSE